MKIVIACGGSGGHIFPALSLARELKGRDPSCELAFVSSNKLIEKEILDREGYRVESLSVIPMPKRPSIAYFSFALKSSASAIKALLLLKKFKPNCVIGFGGYASFPVVMAARLIGCPALIHEQNVRPGIANRISACFVDRVAVGFERTKGFFKRDVVVSGNPVRPGFAECTKPQGLARFNLRSDLFKVLVMGGSQGARRINEAVIAALGEMSEAQKAKFQMIHLAGINNFDIVLKEYQGLNVEYQVFAFLDEVWFAYRASDLVIARCGAGTISEIACCGLPAILIPYPHAGGHQRENAALLSEVNGAIVIDEEKLSGTELKEHMLRFAERGPESKRMGQRNRLLYNPNSAQILADEVLQLVK